MVAVLKSQSQCPSLVADPIDEEVTAEDEAIFHRVNDTGLSPAQQERIKNPQAVYPHQREVLAVHWHPEFVPVHLAIQRMQAMFPNRQEELVIPTQHNVLLTHAEYSGVEVDCYSQGFNQKVQLLLHFRKERVAEATVLASMLEHTRQYRATQLFDFIHSFTKPVQDRLDVAAKETGADAELVRFTSIYVHKIQTLLDRYLPELCGDMIKNKLLRNYFDALRPIYGHQVIDRAQTFLKAVKNSVKQSFPLHYFYRTSEIIEEARSLGAGIVVPHPEQFWPILLAEYDVDGYEVWNPQSQRYTDFLISVVNRKNRERHLSRPPILIFMGDDTHMGEKVRDPEDQDLAKTNREIGYQPAWEDMTIRKRLILNQVDRKAVISEYRSRLAA